MAPAEETIGNVIAKPQNTLRTSRRFTGVPTDAEHRRAVEDAILDISERDQRRIAHDLHDGLCQELAGIAFSVQSLQRSASQNKVVEAAELGTIIQKLQDAVRHARGLSRSLDPV